MIRLPGQQRLLEERARRVRVAEMACVLLMTVGLMGAGAFASGDEIARKDAQRLTNLVRQDCGSCHGLTLKGGLGKPLTAEALGQWDREQLKAIILNGVPGTPMPPWRSLLSESEARWIADKLKRGELQ